MYVTLVIYVLFYWYNAMYVCLLCRPVLLITIIFHVSPLMNSQRIFGIIKKPISFRKINSSTHVFCLHFLFLCSWSPVKKRLIYFHSFQSVFCSSSLTLLNFSIPSSVTIIVDLQKMAACIFIPPLYCMESRIAALRLEVLSGFPAFLELPISTSFNITFTVLIWTMGLAPTSSS